MGYAENFYSQGKADIFRSSSRALINTDFSNEFIVNQNVINSTLQKVAELDFTPHGYKLQKEYGWSEEKINHTIKLYQEWLTLQVHYEELSFAPSELVDEFWHIHILDTRKYFQDCNKIKGSFIHHYPYFGLTEQENETVLEQGFELTKKLYSYHFNRTELGFRGEAAASCGCRSGNGSSCR